MARGREAAAHAATLAAGDPRPLSGTRALPAWARWEPALHPGCLRCGWAWGPVHPTALTDACLHPVTPPPMKPPASGTQKRCPPWGGCSLKAQLPPGTVLPPSPAMGFLGVCVRVPLPSLGVQGWVKPAPAGERSGAGC